MELIADLLSWGFMLAGGSFLIISGIGILRMPDVYTRLHAAGIADTLGVDLIITGLVIQTGLSLISIKLLLILVFLTLTSPVATHSVARAALQSGVEPLLDEPERH